MAADPFRPLSLRRDGDGLLVEWADGAKTFVSWRAMRKACPCATCVDERAKPADPFRVLSAQEAAAGPPAPMAMTAVGRYAYQVAWNDGHSSGIYPLEAIRDLGEAR
jgi:DUF971 family protein